MSFGLSLSDVRLAYELGIFIYEKAFSTAQGAHIQYFDFGRDIKALAETLQRLEQIIINADSQKAQRPWQKPDDEYRAALQPVGEAAGDFKRTLDDCQNLLANNIRFQRNSASFVHNVQWSLGAERDVNILRDRVRFHLIKLGILLKPFEILLLLEIRGELRNIRWDLAEIKELLAAQISNPSCQSAPYNFRPYPRNTVLPQVPLAIAARFVEALSICPPTSLEDVSNLPLQATVDALVYHFSRSTIEYNPGLDFRQRVPKVPQYLNLLKSRWLLGKLEQSSGLSSQGPQAFWAGYLAEIRNEIIGEYRRFEAPPTLEAPAEDVALLLSDDCFSIWVSEPLSLEPASLAEQGPTEEKILEVDLPDPSPSRQCSLTVLKRSSIEFRLVTTMVDKHNKDFRHEKEIVVNTDASAIVPTYAVLSDMASPNSLLISNRHVHDLNWQLLKTSNDVNLLQQALLGYRVFHNMSDICWSINGSSKPGQTGRAQMQLWELKALKDPAIANTSIPPQHVPTSNMNPHIPVPSQESRIPLGNKRRSTLSGTTMLSGQSMTSRVTGSRGQGTVLLPPNPPVFVLFTMYESKHAFLHLELSCDVVVNKNQCDCRNNKKPCSSTVLASEKKELKIRRYCNLEASDQGLASWDLALFRYPQHPKYKDIEILPKVKYLRLDFPSPALNREFQNEVEAIHKVRNLNIRSYKTALDSRRGQEGQNG
ncbi:MAG: hypothetical protein Q9170_007647 [Blastenia crenularia]